jgi:hypothetical protein
MSTERKGLVFIVDISGYSQFIRGINLSQGMVVIRRLLNAIIEENRLSFKISEIEGDAVLFYRFGAPPSMEEILSQFSIMLNTFKQILLKYLSRIPGIKKLSLKAVAHYGYMEEFQIDRFRKLYGITLIDAHRLLKNSIPSDTYVMVTTEYLKEVSEFPLDFNTSCGTYQCDSYDVGALCYTYFAFKNQFIDQEQMTTTNFASC